MAHAPAELRDPTTSPGKPPPGRADDLLSQLAGKEIDRLLADADLDGESAFGAAPPPTRPTSDRRGDRASTSAGHDVPESAGPAPAHGDDDATAGHAGETAEDRATDAGEHDDSPLNPEAHDALAGAQDTLSKELDQVFDRQLDDATGGGGNSGSGDRAASAAAGANSGGNAGTVTGRRPSAETRSDETAEVVETHADAEVSAAATSAARADDSGHAGLDAVAAAEGGHPAETTGAVPAATTAAAEGADGVGDLLSRLSAGERPPPPEEGSIVAAAADPAANHGEHASPDAHTAADAAHHDHPTDEKHAAHSEAVAMTQAGHTPDAERESHSAGGDGHAAFAPHTEAAGHADPAAATGPAAGGATHADVVHLPAAEPGPSVVDKVLAVLAIPLDPFPDEVRDAVGKVAIITAVNGVAVLVYVMFFRG